MTETGGALADFKTARLAKIVLPGIEARSLDGFAFAERLRTGEGRSLFQRKPDLRIGGQIGVPAPLARAATGDDVTARPIAGIRRPRDRPLGKNGRQNGAR